MAHEIETFFDERTWTLTYVLHDPETRDAIVIDPVLDYEPASSKLWTESADEILAYLTEHDLKLRYILETHAHADHLSGSQILKEAYPEAILAIGARITEVQRMFKMIFALPDSFSTDGSQFDELLEAGKRYEAGSLSFEVIGTPGHTPADVAYLFGQDLFVGDVLFMPDMGTGRCDFPGGSAEAMYESIMNLYELPATTRVHVGHDYMPGGRELKWVASVAEHRESNVALPAARAREDFIAWRKNRDASLDAPKLLFQSVQVNVDAGSLPEPEADSGKAFLKIPINIFRANTSDEDDLSVEEIDQV